MSAKYGRALVVEDDSSWQQVLGELLSDMGLTVDSAATLDTARARLHVTPYRLAVVDLSLAGADHRNQDGLSVLEEIRRHSPGCVAFLLTGFATVEVAVGAITGLGAYTCLRKEAFHRAEFRRLVQQALAVAPEESAPTLAAAPPPSAAAPEHGRKRRAVLIVEDDAGWRSLLGELVQEAGYKARLCSGYGESLGYLRRQTFGLMIVDLSLASSLSPAANSDGLHVLAQARAAAIPAIVVSGTAAPPDVDRVYADYGIRAYFEKQSFDRAAFRQALLETLGNSAGSSELSALTQREHEALRLLAQGKTNKEIAAELVISVNTVKRHLKVIFHKLGVSTRAAAAALAAGETR